MPYYENHDDERTDLIWNFWQQVACIIVIIVAIIFLIYFYFTGKFLIFN